MTKEELLSLVNAGFTKDDIISLSATKEFKEAQPEEASKEVSVNAEETPKETPVVAEASNENEALLKVNEAIDNFTKKLESFNINNAEMQRENRGDENLEEILARVLLPDGKEVK